MSCQEFQYKPGDRWAPIPPHEQGLQTLIAEPFFQISKKKMKHMEGLCFDRNGDLLFVSIYEGSVCKLDMKTKTCTRIYQDLDLRPTAVKIHKDGRLFVCCIDYNKSGRILVMDPDGSNCEVVIAGWSVDDMVFDSKGGFYFTHFSGTFGDPWGGVYHVSPDFRTITPITKNMAAANGVALSKDEMVLWITELGAGRLHRFDFKTGRTSVPYHFSGAPGPDSACIDNDDNLYVAMADQARAMIFNPFGLPIGQVLLPDRDLGRNHLSTSVAIHPDKKELYIITCDDRFDEGAWIFRSGSFAPGSSRAYQFL